VACSYASVFKVRRRWGSKEVFMKWETPQKWETPHAIDLRFGMEITMYIANR
jgi:coenzyme PQQ precursor peptide PqqA